MEYPKKEKNGLLFISSIIVTIIGLVIFVWFCIRGYFYEQYIIPTGIISLEKSSQFGDFIGGCCGALFALVGVLLLFETLKLQYWKLYNNK